MISKTLAAVALSLGLSSLAWTSFDSGLAAVAQDKPDDKYRPDTPEDDQPLTPEQALRMLEECRRLMGLAEEDLNDSSKGKVLETEKELVEKIEKLLRDDPASVEKRVLETIRRLLKRSERSQVETVKKLEDVIRRARAQSASSGKPQPSPPQPQTQRPPRPGDPAKIPYEPNRTDDVLRFRSEGDRTGRWGDLPARLREAIRHARRDLDDVPAEYRELYKRYSILLAEDKR